MLAHRSAKIDFLVQILGGNSFEEFGEGIFLAPDRFDDNAARLLTHLHGIIQAELGGLQDCGGNAHPGAVAPFLCDGSHRRYRLPLETFYQHQSLIGSRKPSPFSLRIPPCSLPSPLPSGAREW